MYDSYMDLDMGPYIKLYKYFLLKKKNGSWAPEEARTIQTNVIIKL